MFREMLEVLCVVTLVLPSAKIMMSQSQLHKPLISLTFTVSHRCQIMAAGTWNQNTTLQQLSPDLSCHASVQDATIHRHGFSYNLHIHGASVYGTNGYPIHLSAFSGRLAQS